MSLGLDPYRDADDTDNEINEITRENGADFAVLAKIDALFGAETVARDTDRPDVEDWLAYKPNVTGFAPLDGFEGEEGFDAYLDGDADADIADAAPPMFELPPLTRTLKKPQPIETEGPQNVELWKVLFAVLVCMLFAMGSYLVGRVYGATLIPDEPAYAAVIEPSADTATTVTPGKGHQEVAKGPQILTALLMGTDQRYKNEMARADTIILVTINLDTLDIHMISIPRDTRGVIADSDSITKINAAHAIGGPELMRKTVEDLLDITIHYYAETNFQGFAKCVDILGGVDYHVERRMYFPEEGIDLMPGQQKLNGDKSLQYVRWRGDPTADIGRVGRQQKFVKALLEQSMQLATVPRLPELVSAVRENIITDMSAAQILNLATRLLDIQSLSFESATLPGEAKTIGGGAYWVMDEAETRTLLEGIFGIGEPEPEVEEAVLDADADEIGVADGGTDETDTTGETDATDVVEGAIAQADQ